MSDEQDQEVENDDEHMLPRVSEATIKYSKKVPANSPINLSADFNLQSQPLNYHEQIIRYLKQQECHGEEENHSNSLRELPQEAADNARAVLLKLLNDVNNIIGFKEAHALEQARKNQHELFDLTKKVDGFYISDQVMEKLAFNETLIIGRINDMGQSEPVGGLSMDVQSALGSKGNQQEKKKIPDFTKTLYTACADMKTKYMEEAPERMRKDLEEYRQYLKEEMNTEYRKFLLHLSSQFNVDGRNAGSRMTSWVDRNLHTIEEKRSEFIDSGASEKKTSTNDTIEKKSYVFMAKKHYDVRADPGGCDHSNKYCYSFRRAEDYVGEGANVILMRYLAYTRFIGTFEMSTLHINGQLARNIYQCEGPIGGYINNVRMDLCKIYRTIIEECGVVQRSCTVLALDGRIMKHDWEGCDYVLQINPLEKPTKKRPNLILHLNEAWKYDLQLLSRYLDKKFASSLNMKSYLQDHKEIGNMINDFIQNVLQIKPENIIDFAKHYFLSYAPFLLPRTGYFEPQDNTRCFNNEE